MNIRRVIVLALTLGLLLPAAAAAAPTRSIPQDTALGTFVSGPCAPGGTYESACDVNHDGVMDVLDVQLTAGRWNQAGTWMSDNDHNHLGQTWTGNDNPLTIEGSFGTTPDNAPLILSNSDGDGLKIEATGFGVKIASDNLGLRINSSGGTGIYVQSAYFDGLTVASAGYVGVTVNNAGNDGVIVERVGFPSDDVSSTAKNGFEVKGAEGNGLFVGQADADGVHVHAAGAASASTASSSNNGVEIEGAQGYGMYIGRSDSDGIRIRSTGDDGIQIGEDGVYPNYGLYIPGPGTTGSALLPTTANANGEWALITVDNINAGNVLLSAQSLLAVVGDGQTLAVGEVVTAAGLAGTLPDGHDRLARVQRAGAGNGIVGVVSSRMALQAMPGKDGAEELHSIDGAAQPGDYVAIAVLGAAQVKVQDGEVLQPGQRVTVGADGAVRALQTRTVEGMEVSEGAATLGVVLEAPKDGMVWVLVNPQ